MGGLSTGIMNLTQCDVTINGLPIGGAGEGDFVVIEWSAPIYNFKTGAGGDDHRATSNDQGAAIKIKVAQTSVAFVTALDAILRRHEQGLGGSETIVVRNRGTGKTYSCFLCYPTDRPNESFGNTVADLEYAFRSPNVQR